VASADSDRSVTPAIRRADPTDARALAAIGVMGWQTAYRSIMPGPFLDSLSVETRERAWLDRLQAASDAAPAWIATRDGQPLGFLCGGPPRDEDAPPSSAEVYGLYVLPDVGRSGVGRALLETALEHWRRRGIETALLWVFEANAAARRFYEALGWQADGARQEVDLGGFAPPEVRYRRAIGR
jgi:ribosomal protein S18 acetylase RimI-like enzyme